MIFDKLKDYGFGIATGFISAAFATLLILSAIIQNGANGFYGYIAAFIMLIVPLITEYEKAIGIILSYLSFLVILSIIPIAIYFKTFTFSLWIIPVFLLVLLEFIFWVIDKEKPKKKDNKFTFTIKRKLLALLDATLIGTGALWIYNGALLIKEHISPILKWIGYIGAGILGIAAIIGVLYLFIKLNSLKYNRK